jgi:L-threonylcarbamoyladenylate synthase
MRTERLRVGFARSRASIEALIEASAHASIERAAEVLRGGGLVAFPTETVYGLGARADSAEAVRRIFLAKGRPPGNPLIVHVRSAEDAALLCASWPEEAERLASAFWPGPLTLIAARRPDRVASEAAAGGPTVGIRVPAHPIARALLDACGLPVAAPSANQSTSISPTTADHVMKSLGGRIDMVLDGGPTGYGIESTIVDVTTNPVVILRHGAIPLSAIEALVPAVDRAGATVDPSQRARAPGSHARHYAPRARVILAPAADIFAEASARRERGERVGVLALEEAGSNPAAGSPALLIEALPADPVGYAAGLYAALHRLEDAVCDTILIAEVPDAPSWTAIRDRLRRASA